MITIEKCSIYDPLTYNQLRRGMRVKAMYNVSDIATNLGREGEIIDVFSSPRPNHNVCFVRFDGGNRSAWACAAEALVEVDT